MRLSSPPLLLLLLLLLLAVLVDHLPAGWWNCTSKQASTSISSPSSSTPVYFFAIPTACSTGRNVLEAGLSSTFRIIVFAQKKLPEEGKRATSLFSLSLSHSKGGDLRERSVNSCFLRLSLRPQVHQETRRQDKSISPSSPSLWHRETRDTPRASPDPQVPWS